MNQDYNMDSVKGVISHPCRSPVNADAQNRTDRKAFQACLKGNKRRVSLYLTKSMSKPSDPVVTPEADPGN